MNELFSPAGLASQVLLWWENNLSECHFKKTFVQEKIKESLTKIIFKKETEPKKIWKLS